MIFVLLCVQCKEKPIVPKNGNIQDSTITASYILGNPDFLAMSYGGYRKSTRDIQPTLKELKEDLLIMQAMGIRIIRTYNVQLPHASHVLLAIKELKAKDPTFEMYVMLGAWIDCHNAWTSTPNHDKESTQNQEEIARAVALAQQYPDIVKIIAVGNEAMVKWAASYYVQPDIILKWVNHLQDLKKTGKLDKDLWITSSDNFASWGGAEKQYHTPALNNLISAVDYLSVHTYPMHDTHYNPDFWGILEKENKEDTVAMIKKAMQRAQQYAIQQVDSVKGYLQHIGIKKPIHIGETGWASLSNGFYGTTGSKATDEYKEALYYNSMRAWTKTEEISCFYFEAFDEPWKDATNPSGAENHFGLFTVDGKAKFALWNLVDDGVFEGLSRSGNPITKTYKGNKNKLMKEVALPPFKNNIKTK